MQYHSNEKYLQVRADILRQKANRAELDFQRASAEYQTKLDIYSDEIESIEAQLKYMDELKEQTKAQVNEREGARVGSKTGPVPPTNFHDTF